MLGPGCSHGVRWEEPCRECEIVSLRETIANFEPKVIRAKQRLAELTHSAQETLPAHLQDDAPYKQCDICGRKSWEQPGIGVACDMRQPNGWRCDGTLIPTPNRRV